MRQVLKYVLAGASAAVLSFALTNVACTQPPTTGSDAGYNKECAANPVGPTCKCAKSIDCDPLHPENKYHWLCPLTHQCNRICKSNSDCTALAKYDPAYSKYVCQDALCLPPFCGSDSECSTDGTKYCAGGTCLPLPTAGDVTACVVLPANALVHQGSAATFTVLATGATGTVPYKSEVTWSVDNSASAQAAGTSITGTVTGGATAGTFAVQAKIGSVTCTPASAVNYANVEGGKTRVVVADILGHTPVAGATVIDGNLAPVTTDSSGVATFDGADASAKTISVFDQDYSYLTMVGVTGTDLIAYVKPAAKVGSFTGTMNPRDFDALSDLKGTVHFALYGGSIPGNLIDLNLSTLLGKSVKTKINLGSQSTTVPLPEGVVMGLGEQMFTGIQPPPADQKTSHYTVKAPAGKRTLWGIGGNMDFSAITKALGPVLSGGDTSNIDIGGLLTSLLPLLGKLQSGVMTGVDAVDGQTTDVTGKMKLDTLLRLSTVATLPDLPTYNADGKATHFDGAVVLGGAMYEPQGLVPLGLTAGIDQKGGGTDPNDPTKELPDGKIDPAADGLNPGQVALRLAPLHGGLESSKYVALALAASFKGLGSGLGGSGSGSGSTTPTGGLVLSGIVAFPGDITYSNTTAYSFHLGDHFLGVPDTTLTDRTVTLTAVSGAAFERLDIGGEDTGEWSVYLPANLPGGTVDIPAPPAGFDDRLMAAPGATKEPQVLVQTVQLGGGDGSLDYQGVVNFNSDNMDDLTGRINTFSVRQIVRPAP